MRGRLGRKGMGEIRKEEIVRWKGSEMKENMKKRKTTVKKGKRKK